MTKARAVARDSAREIAAELALEQKTRLIFAGLVTGLLALLLWRSR